MDFSSHNPRSSNALSLAARRNDVPNLRRYLKKINPNNVDNRGWTCLHEAAFHDSLECLEIILKRRSCRPLVESHEGHTALYVACLNTFSTRCIQYLLENVDDIANYGSKEGFTPLHLVSRQGRTDALQLLLDHGAIIDVVDFDGDSPLHEACLANQPEIVAMLLHAGAQAEIRNEREATPLHMACSRGCIESVKHLYPFVTDINMVDYNGDTPLMAACHGENEHVIQFLLDHGADPSIINHQSKMAIDLAMERGLVTAFRQLFHVTERVDLSPLLVLAALSPGNLNINIIDMILSSDLDPDFFLFTRPPIIETSFDRLSEILTRFKNGKPSSSKTFAPLCAFLNIAEYVYKLSPEKFDEWFYLILMKGLSVNATNKDEIAPLVWFQYCPHAANFEYVLELLVKFGCNVDYCSDMFRNFTNLPMLLLTGTTPSNADESQINHKDDFPDAFYAALLVDPATMPAMMKYSLHCDPELLLKVANNCSLIEHFPNTAITQITKMIDSDSEIYDYESYTHYIPSLKHLTRMKVRDMIKQKGIKTTRQYLDFVDKLPLPKQIQNYIRFCT